VGLAAFGSPAGWRRFNPPKYQTGTALDICNETLWMLAIVVGRFTFLFVYIRREFSDFHSVHRVNCPKNNRSKSIGSLFNYLGSILIDE
jgi:hypothetical protein